MKVIAKIPVQIYFGFLARFTLQSREYAVLKTAAIGGYAIDVLCDEKDGFLLLDRANQLYPDAVPCIRSALDAVPRSSWQQHSRA
jgi:hypothetical protein